MDIISLQNSLKALYFTLGGSAEHARGVNDLNTIIDEIAALKIGAQIGAILGLPDAPSEDGTYTLQCTVTDGAATYSWEATTPPA